MATVATRITSYQWLSAQQRQDAMEREREWRASWLCPRPFKVPVARPGKERP